MDNYADERDQQILNSDKYTFFVLGRILGTDCRLLFTDHERLIICFTDYPFPVWIWTPDDASIAEMDRAYQLAKDNSLLDGTHHFNLKYELADHFIKQAAADGIDMSISMNMLAYDCPDPIKPQESPDGEVYLCTERDIGELAWFIEQFHNEIGVDRKDKAGCLSEAEDFIRNGNSFFWKDPQGNNTASCRYSPNGNMASINLVYTHPDHRRKHYAENLVYQVTMTAKKNGYVPMLYTNADYKASNACYKKIGYILRGRLCTIS